MKTVVSLSAALLALALIQAPAHADPQADCEAKALSKEGKPLSGAAKNASVKKCLAASKTAACEEKALSKDGKKLSGAAKNAFMKKCEAGSA